MNNRITEINIESNRDLNIRYRDYCNINDAHRVKTNPELRNIFADDWQELKTISVETQNIKILNRNWIVQIYFAAKKIYALIHYLPCWKLELSPDAIAKQSLECFIQLELTISEQEKKRVQR